MSLQQNLENKAKELDVEIMSIEYFVDIIEEGRTGCLAEESEALWLAFESGEISEEDFNKEDKFLEFVDSLI